MSRAEQIFRDKLVYPDGAILEMTIWRVPQPLKGSGHGLKYSLFYGYPGQRVVAYDNEPGKGDHRHYGEVEEAYPFSTVEALLADFLADVRQCRGEK